MEENWNMDKVLDILTNDVQTIIYTQRNIDNCFDHLAMENNVFQELDSSESVNFVRQLKNALITIAAIRANGLNKETVNYLLKKYGISD